MQLQLRSHESTYMTMIQYNTHARWAIITIMIETRDDNSMMATFSVEFMIYHDIKLANSTNHILANPTHSPYI